MIHASDAPYFERQVGGNCRVHAVNMALGGRAITAKSLFTKYSKSYSSVYDVPDSVPFDYVGHDGLTLAAFAAERACSDVFSLGCNLGVAESVYGMSGGAPELIEYAQDYCLGFLIYNADHVWAARGGWLLDSMRSPSRCRSVSRAVGKSHHCCLLLDRSRCLGLVLRLVARGIRFHCRGRSPAEMFASVFVGKECTSKSRVCAALGHLHHLISVGFRACLRCPTVPTKMLNRMSRCRERVVASYACDDASECSSAWLQATEALLTCLDGQQ